MTLDEELARVLPVLREAVRLGVPVSVDTCKPEVMRAVLDLGADIVNDIWALRQPGAAQAVAAHPQCGVCVMHMHGEPASMQRQTMAGDAVPQVVAFLQRETQRLRDMGVAADRIALDPGIGFGKTVDQNFALLARQGELLRAGHPLLVGWSRKSSLGTVSGMIGAFKSIASATEVNAQLVANGIYEALITTVFGLIIAIIAGIFGFTDVQAASATIAQWLFGIFLVLFLGALIIGRMIGMGLMS